MKIKLIVKLPVDKKHGCRIGRVFEVLEEKRFKERGAVRWWITGDAGETVGVLFHEAEVIEDGEDLEAV